MTREEAKEVFLNRGFIKVDGGVVYDANKWREACSVISEWLEQEPNLDIRFNSDKNELNRVKNELETTPKNDLAVREFEEIVVEYPPEDLCIYPEYKGKPYFGIQYRENGESIIGYGTYNPQVLSRYLKDYFMPTTKNDLADRCIDRWDINGKEAEAWMVNGRLQIRNRGTIHNIDLPSVTPQLSSELEKNSKKLEKDFGELDCISRADAIHAVSEALKRTFVEYEDIANKVIGKLPSVTPQEPRWIPCSEKKPDKGGEYLLWGKICDDDDEEYCFLGDYYEFEEKFGIEKGNYDPHTLGFLDTEIEEYYSVVAWMPLPVPFEPQE